MPKAIALAEDVRAVLARAEIGPRMVRITEQLDRELYVRVNKVLEAAGGKWHRPSKAHCFPTDPRDALGLAVETGVIENKKQVLQAFYTPPAVARQVLKAATIGPGMLVLEPSAGSGNLVRAIHESLPNSAAAARPRIHAVEIDRTAADVLHNNCRDIPLSVTIGDFLQCNPADFPAFDRVVMNPPFAENQDIAHVLHAYRFLKPGGRLVSVMSPRTFHGSRQVEQTFQAFVANRGQKWGLPEGAFQESGTAIRTVLVVLDKPVRPDQPTRRPSPRRSYQVHL